MENVKIHGIAIFGFQLASFLSFCWLCGSFRRLVFCVVGVRFRTGIANRLCLQKTKNLQDLLENQNVTFFQLDVSKENFPDADRTLYGETQTWSEVVKVAVAKNVLATLECRSDDLELQQNEMILKFWHFVTEGAEPGCVYCILKKHFSGLCIAYFFDGKCWDDDVQAGLQNG